MGYYAPDALELALEHLSHTPATILAGGTDFFPALEAGKAPSDILDLGKIAPLKTISNTGTHWRIGAMATWSDIINTDLPAVFQGLKQAASEVGSVQIQNAGTIAGNLCNASPAGDGIPPLLTLDAQIELQSAGHKRVLPLAEFLRGVRQTDLQHTEIVTAILVPHMADETTSGFAKLGARKYLVISITMTAVVLKLTPSRHIDGIKIAVGSCSAVAQRLHNLESDLLGQHVESISINPDLLTDLSPISDIRATADFREDVTALQISKVIKMAAAHGG